MADTATQGGSLAFKPRPVHADKVAVGQVAVLPGQCHATIAPYTCIYLSSTQSLGTVRPVYRDRRFATLQRTLFIYLINKYISLSDICLTVHH